jgi:endoglucanase
VTTRPVRGALGGALRFALPGIMTLAAAPLAASATPEPAPAARLVVAGTRLYVDPASAARRQVDAWRRARPADAERLERIASQPMAVWMGGWNGDVRRDVDAVVSAANRAGAVPVLVAYNIPNRDCGQHSAGGAGDAAGYRRWIRAFAAGVADRGAIVILEPDALALTGCLGEPARQARFALLREAVQVLEARGAAVYLDAGHSRWVAAADMAERLRAAGIADAHGFALNVSNFQSTASNTAFGEALSALVGGKHYVIDTSRNGSGAAGGEWCNPGGRSLGESPTTRTGRARLDALLWIKRPGESDGRCNGGPSAGAWWAEGALALAR